MLQYTCANHQISALVAGGRMDLLGNSAEWLATSPQPIGMPAALKVRLMFNFFLPLWANVSLGQTTPHKQRPIPSLLALTSLPRPTTIPLLSLQHRLSRSQEVPGVSRNGRLEGISRDCAALLGEYLFSWETLEREWAPLCLETTWETLRCTRAVSDI